MLCLDEKILQEGKSIRAKELAKARAEARKTFHDIVLESQAKIQSFKHEKERSGERLRKDLMKLRRKRARDIDMVEKDRTLAKMGDVNELANALAEQLLSSSTSAGAASSATTKSKKK